MRFRSLVLVSLLTFTSNAWAKDVYLSIAGTVGAFRTDLRIVNPSTTKDIQIQVYLLPAGNTSFLPDNSGVQPKTITISKRQMAIYNDVVTSLFQSSGLGAIRLKSDDDFIATERIYATTDGGTLGQFVIPIDATAAKTKGIIPQLQAFSSNTGKGSFRTNLGAVNPNSATAHVTFTLYDKNNAIVAQAQMTMPPFSATSPLAIAYLGGSVFTNVSADLTDSWVSYSSDLPVIGWGSTVDNGTTDQIFVPPFEDTGVTQPPPATTKEFNVTLNSFRIDVDPDPSTLRANDKVVFHIKNEAGVTHGFQLNGPDGRPLIDGRTYSRTQGTVDQSFTMNGAGTYFFFCTVPTCGTGHGDMSGSFTVGNTNTDDPGGHY